MNTTSYLQKQFANLRAVFHGIVDDLTDDEWVARPTPNLNPVGCTVWHLPRTQDTFVQTWIRGLPEVAHRDRWAVWQPLKHLGVGVGISGADADHIARSIKKTDVLEYADEVHQTVSAWLGAISDNDLDQTLDSRQHLAGFPEYQTTGFVEEIANLYDQPVWALLLRPCLGHIHRHLGELEVVKTILRAPA